MRTVKAMWRQAIQDKFHWILGLTICTASLLMVAPVVKEVINS